jgi:hypothetical protein
MGVAKDSVDRGADNTVDSEASVAVAVGEARSVSRRRTAGATEDARLVLTRDER